MFRLPGQDVTGCPYLRARLGLGYLPGALQFFAR